MAIGFVFGISRNASWTHGCHGGRAGGGEGSKRASSWLDGSKNKTQSLRKTWLRWDDTKCQNKKTIGKPQQTHESRQGTPGVKDKVRRRSTAHTYYLLSGAEAPQREIIFCLVEQVCDQEHHPSHALVPASPISYLKASACSNFLTQRFLTMWHVASVADLLSSRRTARGGTPGGQTTH